MLLVVEKKINSFYSLPLSSFFVNSQIILLLSFESSGLISTVYAKARMYHQYSFKAQYITCG
jgi:hypothetical protein